jgi:poly(A) polymerase
MDQPIKDAASICKIIMRNGYDAYVINAALQRRILALSQDSTVEISTDIDFAGLSTLFPEVEPGEGDLLGRMSRKDSVFLFRPADTVEGSHPEACVARITTSMLKKLESDDEFSLYRATSYVPRPEDIHGGLDTSDGQVRLAGVPDETLRHDYLRAIRALRFSANFHLPIEENTWISIIRASRRVLDYVSVTDIMDEWRKVEAENMWRFVELLFESTILHGFLPELAAMTRVFQVFDEEKGPESIWDHTLKVMRRYPEELPYDWYGTLACLFHDCGKLYVGEHGENGMTFYQHHQVGAKLARKILKRLRLNTDEVDTICNLVRHHMRFHFMLTDKGIRRFKALDDYPRLIEMARADVKACNGTYTEFNHNMKMLERADISKELLEPLLNGKQIMDIAGLKPGPAVGLLRDNLLQAQIAGDVNTVEEAERFVLTYKEKEQL